ADMGPERLRELLDQVASGVLDPVDALARLKMLPFEDLGFAKIDHHRTLRNGLPEVVFAQGKTAEQIARIAMRMRDAGEGVLITRLEREVAAEVLSAVPELDYHDLARVAVLPGRSARPRGRGTILVIAAGTADLPISE